MEGEAILDSIYNLITAECKSAVDGCFWEAEDGSSILSTPITSFTTGTLDLKVNSHYNY